jgi:hypothetical protein
MLSLLILAGFCFNNRKTARLTCTKKVFHFSLRPIFKEFFGVMHVTCNRGAPTNASSCKVTVSYSETLFSDFNRSGICPPVLINFPNVRHHDNSFSDSPSCDIGQINKEKLRGVLSELLVA